MTKNASVNLNSTKDRERWLPCSECDGRTNHKVLASANTSEIVDRRYDTEYYENYEIVQCQGCKTISFRKAWRDSQDLSCDEVGDIYDIWYDELYPGRVAGRRILRLSSQLPPQIVSIYIETHAALCNKLPILTGVGVRALIDVVCKDKSTQGATLEQKIDSLETMGVLTKDGADILHSLRIMGNEAAHEVKPHSEEELNIAFDVVEHLLEGVYLLPKKAANLPKRSRKV